MQYKVLKNCGELGIEFDNLKGLGERNTKDFLTKLLENIIKRATRYHEETDGDHVFRYREKQLHSVVCPSIADITPSFLIEHPTERKPRGTKAYPGNVDYWVSYKHLCYLVELKHTYFAYNQNKPRQGITRKFSHAIQQLDNIRKAECEYLSQGHRKLFKIALEAITFQKGSRQKKKVRDFDGETIKIAFQKLMSIAPLKDETNIRSVWILDKRLVDPFEYSNGFWIYPAVAFIGKVFSENIITL